MRRRRVQYCGRQAAPACRSNPRMGSESSGIRFRRGAVSPPLQFLSPARVQIEASQFDTAAASHIASVVSS
jgi:hypothetical protein